MHDAGSPDLPLRYWKLSTLFFLFALIGACSEGAKKNTEGSKTDSEGVILERDIAVPDTAIRAEAVRVARQQITKIADELGRAELDADRTSRAIAWRRARLGFALAALESLEPGSEGESLAAELRPLTKAHQPAVESSRSSRRKNTAKRPGRKRSKAKPDSSAYRAGYDTAKRLGSAIFRVQAAIAQARRSQVKTRLKVPDALNCKQTPRGCLIALESSVGSSGSSASSAIKTQARGPVVIELCDDIDPGRITRALRPAKRRVKVVTQALPDGVHCQNAINLPLYGALRQPTQD